MSVQAQHPSNVLLTEFRKRSQAEACNGIEDFSMQENPLHLHCAGVNSSPQSALNATSAENVFLRNAVSARKKARVNEGAVLRQQISTVPLVSGPERFVVPVCNNERGSFAVPTLISQPSSRPGSASITTAFESAVRCNLATGLTAGVMTSLPSLGFIPDAYLQLHYCQQEAEIDQIIRAHEEQLRQALEERRQQHTRALYELVDQCVVSCIRERLVEIEKVRQRNVELEDCVKQLSLESQVWKNVAHSHEALVNSLRSHLERVVAQSKEQSKGRFGESDAEDAESCIHGESADKLGDPFRAHTAEEIKDLKEHRNCRVCKKNSMSVLLLPCRHLCLCTDCDTQLSHCPICGDLKSASLQVYVD